MKATVQNSFFYKKETNWIKTKATIQNKKKWYIIGLLYPIYQKQNSDIFLAHHNNKLNQ